MSRTLRHVPTRTCVVCRQKRTKPELLRVSKSQSGGIELDPEGKIGGRGAYVCFDSEHITSDRINKSRLDSALRTNIENSTVSELTKAIESLLASRLK